MRILVTGAAGFIGSHLAAHLARRGYDVVGSDIQPRPARLSAIAWESCDLLDARGLSALMDRVRPETVLHLGARTDLDEKSDLSGYAANIEGVRNLLQATRAVGTVRRMVCTSSQLVCEIGYQPRSDDDYKPSTLYGESKVKTEQICRVEDGGGAEWCLVRPTSVWGPHMNPHYLRFFNMLRRGRYFKIGDGTAPKSYSYVGNIVRQYEVLVTTEAPLIHRRTLYLADYEPITLASWSEAFRAAIGGPPIRSLPLWIARTGARIGDVINALGLASFPLNSFRLGNVLSSYVVDTRPIHELCPTLPFSMQEGVAETVTWLEQVWESQRPKHH
jgi:nucleoside-diphosphate-sugar epimerase